jgi:hypothetical protein
LTDARDRIALRIEERRAMLNLADAPLRMALTASITAYETALADIDAWMAEPEEPEETATEEEAEAAAEPLAPAPPSPVHGGGVGWGDQPAPPAAATAQPDPAEVRLAAALPASKRRSWTPEQRAASAAPPVNIPADDLAEARTMMRSGKCGALQLAEYFGWTREQAQDVAAMIRAEQSAAKAA